MLPLLLDLVEPGAAWVAGLPFEYQARCPSTNASLRQIAQSGRSGTMLVTDEQTGGRGRLGRTWVSAPGLDLTFSVLLRPSLSPARGHLLALATGVAVAEVLEEGFGLEGQVTLKWPNDVLLDGKKVCGILLEASADAERILWAVAGIGLNVNSQPSRLLASLPSDQAAEWRGRPLPVSLKEHLGQATPRAPLLAALLARLSCWWTGLDWAQHRPQPSGRVAPARRAGRAAGGSLRRRRSFGTGGRGPGGGHRRGGPVAGHKRGRGAAGGVRGRRERDGAYLTEGADPG